MKHIKPINEFWNPFKKKISLTTEQVEEKCTELVDIIYDIFDEYNIIDGNSDYESSGDRYIEPSYDHWRYAKYGFPPNKDNTNPKDRIIIVINNVDIADNVYSKIGKIKKNIENQIGCEINIFYNLKKKSDIFDNIGRGRNESGRIVISLLHGLKLKSQNPFGGDAGPG